MSSSQVDLAGRQVYTYLPLPGLEASTVSGAEPSPQLPDASGEGGSPKLPPTQLMRHVSALVLPEHPSFPPCSDHDICGGISGVGRVSVKQHFAGSGDFDVLGQVGERKLWFVGVPIQCDAAQALQQPQPHAQLLADVTFKVLYNGYWDFVN